MDQQYQQPTQQSQQQYEQKREEIRAQESTVPFTQEEIEGGKKILERCAKMSRENNWFDTDEFLTFWKASGGGMAYENFDSNFKDYSSHKLETADITEDNIAAKLKATLQKGVDEEKPQEEKPLAEPGRYRAETYEEQKEVEKRLEEDLSKVLSRGREDEVRQDGRLKEAKPRQLEVKEEVNENQEEESSND